MRGILLSTLIVAGIGKLLFAGARGARERNRALLDALVENCTDVIWLKDAAGVYRACNHAAAATLGLSRASIVGYADADLFMSDIADRHRQADLAVMQSRRPSVEEQQVLSGIHGATRVFDLVKTPVMQRNGTIAGVLGVARDVTEHRDQERKILEQEVLLQEMSTLARIGGWEMDLVAATFKWSAELARIHEFDPAQPLTFDMCLSHYGDADRARIERALGETMTTGVPNDEEVEMNLPSGVRKWMRAHWRATLDQGKVTRIWGMVQDVTERRRLDESMRTAELIYRTTSDAILVTDLDNVIVDANPAFVRLLGYAREDVIGSIPRAFLDDPYNDALSNAITQALDERGNWGGELRLRRKDGTIVDVHIEINIIRDFSGVHFRRIVNVTDLTEQKRKDEQIWRRTNFDLLTGLPNRGLFLDRLGQEVRKAEADGGSVGVLCIDLDRFTHVNDALGHAGGDGVLVQTAARIRACLSEGATVGRLGNDRFAAVVASDCARPALDQTAAALVRRLSMPLDDGADHVYLSASIGITVCPDDARDAGELMKGAEHAMALAKRSGGNRFQYFTPALQQAAMAKVALTNDLRQALARKQLQLHYQPIVNLSQGDLRKAEALLRWHHPVHGIIGPAQFIPLAEETGMIVSIGDWVIEEAIASVARWREQFGVSIELSVNNSPAQFERSASAGWIERFVNSGLPAHSIAVEITESMLVDDVDQVRACLRRLQDHGARVSLDDFGTGFSALSYLKQFDVDYLKIDKSFIHNLVTDEDDKALTQTIIDMAHKLGIETIAEGVETAGQRDILAAFGCDYLQGYLFSRPVPRDEFETLLMYQKAC